MANTFQRDFTLVAHTPLIHFQPDMVGAALRATEVKPKLDRYLGAMYQKQHGTAVPTEWLLSEGKRALRYKLRFRQNGVAQTVELGKGDYALYYGNMGVAKDTSGTAIEKKGILGDMTATVVCMIPELMTFLCEHFADFFAVTNFGTMQGKGFGSFTVKDDTRKASEIAHLLKTQYGAGKCYLFRTNGDHPLKAIKNVYAQMKSGMGQTPSFLFRFMEEEHGIIGEKKPLKAAKLLPAKKPVTLDKDADYFYVRALLGVGERLYFQDSKTEIDVAITNIDKAPDNPDKRIVERMASPVFFKVIGGQVFFLSRGIDTRIFGKIFRFSAKDGESIDLEVPVMNETVIDDFLAFFKCNYHGKYDIKEV